jgi:hypothetical protein
VSAQFCEKLERAQDLLAHRVPGRDVAEVLERALDALINATVKQRFAQTDAPRKRLALATEARALLADASLGPKEVPHDPVRPSKRTRHIPSEVKRRVFERDGGQCTFVSDSGRRCEARAFIEFDHTVLFSRGGEHSSDGLRLRCRAHNQLSAERKLGKQAIDAAINWRRRQPPNATSRVKAEHDAGEELADEPP